MRFSGKFSAPLLPAAGLLLACLGGCAVGPDYERPAAPVVSAYESTPLPETTSAVDHPHGASQKLAMGQDIPAAWWTLFRSEPLNRLIEQSLKENPDLAAAEATLRQASENVAASEASWFPFLDGGANAGRQKTAGVAGRSGGSAYNLYNASVQLSYPLDIFGLTARTVEQAEAREQYQRYQLEAARLTLTGNVVTAAVQEASLRGRIEAEKQIIASQQRQMEILRTQFELGAVSKAGVLAQEAQLAQARATLPPLEQQLAQTRHQLSILAGRFPSEEPENRFDLTGLALPEDVPLSLPSKLVEQRPDIMAAEASLHAASAAIGVATATMFPQITLSGELGSQAYKIGDWFGGSSEIWNFAAGITQPLFHGGQLLHERRGAEAAFDNAAALYRSTVLSAFKDVADTLRALQSDADTLKASVEAERAASASLALTRQQYEAGAVDYLNLLNAERTEEQARLSRVQAEAQRLADTAALFVALGGGWWNAPPADTVDVTATPGLPESLTKENQPSPTSPVAGPPVTGDPSADNATPADI